MAGNGSVGKELSPQQTRAIGAMLTTRTIGEAAAQAGVGERTLARWLHDPAFQAALRAAEANLIDDAQRHLLTLQRQAIEALGLGLRDSQAAIRLRAAGMILDHTLKLRELTVIEQRLSALEKAHANTHTD